MIKATGKGPNGEDILFIGLSFGNLDRFRAAPMDTFIRLDAKELGLSHDVLIFSGRTEAEMADLVANHLAPDAKVSISDRSKT